MAFCLPTPIWILLKMKGWVYNNMKILVDTNIIIDALTSRQPWNHNAEQIFYMAANLTAEMYITANTATDIYYLLRKHLRNTELAKETMSKLFSIFSILDVTAAHCINALSSAVTDFEDAVLEQTAFGIHMDYIVTRNVKDFQYSSVKVLLPEDLITLMTHS